MREISPSHNVSADEFLERSPEIAKTIVSKIREEKQNGIRPLPSKSYIDNSRILNKEKRTLLIDKIAMLVDENLFGRAEMCRQFASLLQRSLMEYGVRAKVVNGWAMYFENGKELFRWKHAWVRCGKEIIDCNSDILYENPLVPKKVNVKPYWSEVKNIPIDRRLREDKNAIEEIDSDVDNIWWPELKEYLKENIK